MTEDEAFDRLRTLILAVDAESVALGQYDEPLSDVVFHSQQGGDPEGAFAMLTPTGSRDSGDGVSRCYEPITYAGEPRILEVRTEGVAYGWRLDYFASRAADRARAARAALLSARGELELAPATLREVSPIRGSVERNQEEFEGRAVITLTLVAPRQQRTLIDVIESGDIEFAGHGGRPTPVIDELTFTKE